MRSTIGTVLGAAFAALLPLAALPASQPPPRQAGLELLYRGQVSRPTEEGEPGPALKNFTLRYLFTRDDPDSGTELVYVLGEQGRGAWAWPERFGAVTLDAQNKPAAPDAEAALLFEHDGQRYVLPVDLPLFPEPGRLEPGARWTSGRIHYRVLGREDRQGHDCWRVAESGPVGPRALLWVDAAGGLLVGLERRVFVGQGEEHRLSMQLSRQQQHGAEELQRRRGPLEELLALKRRLGRPQREQSEQLAAEQLALADEALPALEQSTQGTELAALVRDIRRDVERQQNRVTQIDALAGRVVGAPAAEFALRTLDGGRLSHDAVRGKVTVLHFWEYRGEPLEEPYGQVGYLDFLHARRRGGAVQVYG
ncbi:MAG: hypothetical protein ACOC46_01885, partial [Pirellulales bacterium]